MRGSSPIGGVGGAAGARAVPARAFVCRRPACRVGLLCELGWRATEDAVAAVVTGAVGGAVAGTIGGAGAGTTVEAAGAGPMIAGALATGGAERRSNARVAAAPAAPIAMTAAATVQGP